jgi:hypothetical protein
MQLVKFASTFILIRLDHKVHVKFKIIHRYILGNYKNLKPRDRRPVPVRRTILVLQLVSIRAPVDVLRCPSGCL